jgi:hypothetical protein
MGQILFVVGSLEEWPSRVVVADVLLSIDLMCPSGIELAAHRGGKAMYFSFQDASLFFYRIYGIA